VDFRLLFPGCGGVGFLQGVLRKSECSVWCFCGEFVVECAANMDSGRTLFAALKMGQGFEIYFRPAILRSCDPAILRTKVTRRR
jgi:hypothetical protein